MQSEIPVFFDAPRHNPEGGNVLYMDGHVEFIRFDPNGKFPMNAQSMDILKSLSAMKSPNPPA
jgi:prepilin-type processing-associated H-X9-DG protein